MAEIDTIDSAKTLGQTRLGFADEKDVDLFAEMLGKFERAELTPDEWRAFRLVNGVYGQRQDDVTMIRVKIPQGILTVPALRALAEVARRYANGRGHVTTRQNIQFHFVKMSQAEEVLRFCADAGMTTREACGNAVRNVTGSPWAGVLPGEPFDPTPYAEALTRHLLRGPWSSKLPRKFKIAFGGSSGGDDVGAAFHDLGFLARTDAEGRHGFRLTIGGGLATLRRNGILAHEFLPIEELFEASEAVVRVFNRTGNREQRHKARLKFVIDRLGAEGFLAEYQQERALIRAEGGRPYVAPPPAPPLELERSQLAPSNLSVPDAFRRTNVRAQKQPGYVAVSVKLTLGDMDAAQFDAVAAMAAKFGAEHEVRLTADQDLVFRFVAEEQLGALHAELVAAGLADAGAHTVLDVTSCPGAMSCKLAVTQSRGLASLVQQHLEARPELAAKAAGLVIKASGCPNSCGLHHVAGLGFQGGMKKVGGRALPLYHLYVGGRVDADEAHFGHIGAKIPARRSGEAVEQLIELFVAEGQPGEDPNAFFGRISVERIKTALGGLLEISEATATAEDFVDLGEDQAYEMVLSEGECAA